MDGSGCKNAVWYICSIASILRVCKKQSLLEKERKRKREREREKGRKKKNYMKVRKPHCSLQSWIDILRVGILLPRISYSRGLDSV